MPINDFLYASNRAQRLADSRELEIAAAFIAGAEITRNGAGEIDYRALDAQPTRTAFTTALIANLAAHVQGFYGVPDANMNDIFVRSGLFREYVGFTPETINALVETAQGRMSQRLFNANIEEPFNQARGRLAGVAQGQLVATDGPDIINYLRNDPGDNRNDPALALINPARLINPVDMAQLIGEYKARDIISPAFIEGKPYQA